ncbi:MAG: outer membrane protein assembly factor BamA [Bacteroidota bacterium]
MNILKALVFLLVGTVSITCLTAQQAPPDDNSKIYVLGGIEVEGAKYSNESAVINFTGLTIGDAIRIPGQGISDAIKRLWRENIFSDVRIKVANITGNKIFLTISVTERPRISKFSFIGVTKSQADDLREKINFIRGTILTESKKQSAKRIIRNFFVEKGFYNTSVEITEAEDEILKNGIVVTIRTDKGRRIKVNEIKVSGNESFSDNKVKTKLKGISEKRFWRLWSRSKYIPKTFREAKANLIMKYNEAGFRDAKVEFDTVYRHDRRTVNVELNVFEGQKYYFREIAFTGNYKYNSEQLQRVLNIKPGDTYSRGTLDARLNGDPNGGDLSSLYLDDGYLFFQADPVEVAVDEDSIDLEIRIIEGPQATVSRVFVEGNTKTSDYVILRNIRTYPGKKFSRSDIIRSQREILALNYFNQETMNVVPIPDINTGTVDIKYIVEERPSDQLQLQGGWGGRIRDNAGRVVGGGFVGTVQLAFNNFSSKRLFSPRREWGGPIPSGDGQRLSLAIQMNGVGYRNFTVSFVEPWLGGKKPNSLGVSSSYVVFQNFRSNYRNSIYTASVDFGQRMSFPDDFFRSQTSLTYKYYDVANPATVFSGFVRADGTPEEQAFVNIIALRQSFNRSSIDAPIYPTSGSTMSLSVEATPPYSLFRRNVDYAELSPSQRFRMLEYHKWRFNSSWFYRLFGKVVLNARMEAGFVGKYNADVGVSPFERFFLGGAGLVGTFGLDGRDIIPLRGYQDNSINNGNQGFVIYNRYLMELRVPLTLNQSAPIWLLGFAEAGNGYDSFRNFNPFRVKRSLGAGVRVMLPMVGLLGLDWAYGFEDRTGANAIGGRQFHFIIGQQF